MSAAASLQQVAAHARDLLAVDATLCYGVDCPTHGKCARYLAMDGVMGARSFIDTCRRGETFPLFISTSPPEGQSHE